MEEWKEIKGFPKLFISSEGRVKSYLRDSNGYIRKLCLTRKGYLTINLTRHKRKYVCQVSHLVAKAFILNDDPFEKRYVYHLNGIKTDNRLENLEWVTYQELVSRGVKMGIDNLLITHKLSEIPIEIIFNQTKYTFESLQKASHYLDINISNLSNWLNHINKPRIDIKIKRISKEK